MLRPFDRRTFLWLGGSAAATVGLSSCSALALDPDEGGNGGGGTGVDTSQKEAPALAREVKAGNLPELAERLPEHPLVVRPQESLGGYGGTMRRAQINTAETGCQYMVYAGLAEWSPTTPSTPQPGLAEGWEISDDGTTYTFTLRSGLKWSDGEPFTTDDIMFVYEHLLQNTDLNPSFPSWLVVDGEPAVFAAPDETTLTVTFTAPHSLFLKYLCFLPFGGGLITPKHYLTQFHPEFVDAAELKAEMKQAAAETWQDLFGIRNNMNLNPDRPNLGPWKLSKAITSTSTTGTVSRNPYYWKVDPEGRQLPYIDEAVFQTMSMDAIGLRSAGGELDLVVWDLPGSALPVLIKNEESKPFTVLEWQPDANTSILLNQSHTDPVIAELFQTLDFRAGFSHALNRTEMNDAILAGQGTPVHPCGQTGDEYFQEGWGQRFLSYDPDEANRRLDAAGIAERDDNGMRLRPDGKPMRFTMRTFEVGIGLDQTTVLEYAKRHLADVGIDTVFKTISQDLWYTEIPQGDFDIICYPFPGYQWDIDPLWYVPVNEFTYWGPRFGRWYHSPKDKFSAEPPDDIKKLQLLYDDLKAAPDDETRLGLGREILKAHDENVWIIGTMPMPYSPVVAADDLSNIRAEAVASFRQHYEGATDLSQLYFAKPEIHP